MSKRSRKGDGRQQKGEEIYEREKRRVGKSEDNSDFRLSGWFSVYTAWIG
jgi:hypothetical protein